MREKKQIPFDPVALDAEIDAAVKASLEKYSKKVLPEEPFTNAGSDNSNLVAASKDPNK